MDDRVACDLGAYAGGAYARKERVGLLGHLDGAYLGKALLELVFVLERIADRVHKDLHNVEAQLAVELLDQRHGRIVRELVQIILDSSQDNREEKV